MRAFTRVVVTAASTAIGCAAGPAYATADDVTTSFGTAYGAPADIVAAAVARVPGTSRRV